MREVIISRNLYIYPFHFLIFIIGLSWAVTTTLYAGMFKENNSNRISNIDHDAGIDVLLMDKKTPDDQDAALTTLIEKSKQFDALAALYCRRGKIRITHIHLPKGIDDLQACIHYLENSSNKNERRIIFIQQRLDLAKSQYDKIKRLSEDEDEALAVRFTALWKLGKRLGAINIVKAEAVPQEFSTLSTNRMVKTGYLCSGSGPHGPDKSFRTKNAGPFWWCDEI